MCFDPQKTYLNLFTFYQVKRESNIVQLLYTDEFFFWEKTHTAEAGEQKTLNLHSLEKLELLKYLDLDSVPHKEAAEFNFPRTLSVLRWKGKSTVFDSINPHGLGHRPRWELPPISLKDMNNLVILELKDWRISTETLQALGELVNLRILSLCQLDGLDSLPEDFGKLSRLKWVELTDLSLSTLPESFGNLSALEHLIIYKSGISELPESFGNLSSLATLHIRDCEKLASLPKSFGNLSLLQELGIRDCAALKHLGDFFGNLRALRHLSLHECPSLETLPATFGDLSALQNLSIKLCRSLKRLPENFGQLSALERLIILGDDNLRELSETFGKLPALTFLSITSCPSLESLPDNFGFLPVLEKLELNQCSRLQALPTSFGQLLSLNGLWLWETHSLELGDKFLFPPSLQDLGMNCNNLERLPESLGELDLLQTLTIEGNGLERLCNGIRHLSTLEKLKINSTRLESLPRGLGKLQSLRKMTISVQRLQSLPDDLGNLPSLQNLTISKCDLLEILPDGLGNIPSLQTVELWNNGRLRTLPDSLGKLVAPQGDGNKRLLQGLCSNGAATKGFMELDVRLCPLLDDSTLERFGWVRDPGDLLYQRRTGVSWPGVKAVQKFRNLWAQLSHKGLPITKKE